MPSEIANAISVSVAVGVSIPPDPHISLWFAGRGLAKSRVAVILFAVVYPEAGSAMVE
jgi:hypothetical protein